jgi:hypothetical protein
VGEVSDQEFIDQVYRPEDIVNDHQEDGMVVVPAYQDRVDAENAIDNAGVPVVHGGIFNMNIYKKTAFRRFFLLK